MKQSVLAKTKGDFDVPGEGRFSVKTLKSFHAGVSVAPRHVAVEQDGVQRQFAVVVVIAAFHS
jgi:hypothetical protein